MAEMIATRDAYGEALVELARMYAEVGRWVESREAAAAALAITQRTGDYLVEGWAWDGTPERLLEEARFDIGNHMP
jgi:hypothetical protein